VQRLTSHRYEPFSASVTSHNQPQDISPYKLHKVTPTHDACSLDPRRLDNHGTWSDGWAPASTYQQKSPLTTTNHPAPRTATTTRNCSQVGWGCRAMPNTTMPRKPHQLPPLQAPACRVGSGSRCQQQRQTHDYDWHHKNRRRTTWKSNERHREA
jgi:hypothetical protein